MNIEKEIITLIEKKCKGINECLIDFNDLPTPIWDNVYIFDNVSKEYIQGKIKVPYNLYKDIGVKIIFIRNQKIAYYQELFPSLDGGSTMSKVIFSFLNVEEGDGKGVNYFHLTPDYAKVKVFKQEYSNDGVNKIVVYKIHPKDAYQQGN